MFWVFFGGFGQAKGKSPFFVVVIFLFFTVFSVNKDLLIKHESSVTANMIHDVKRIKQCGKLQKFLGLEVFYIRLVFL